MISLTLPVGDRRTILRSFWLVISLIFGGGLWLSGWLLNLAFPWALAAVTATVLGSLAWLQEPRVRRLYGAWNRRLIRPLGTLAGRAVMGICFFIIFVVTGKAGSRLRLNGNTATTTWELRNPLPDQAYGLPFKARGALSAKSGWIRNYIRWAIRSGNVWSISLIPFLSFLRMIGDQEQETVEGNIYTLF